MLRHLTSAARTRFRSLFAKPNAFTYVSSRRPLSTRTFEALNAPLGFIALLAGIGLGVVAKRGLEEWIVDRSRWKISKEEDNCYQKKPTILSHDPLDAAVNSIKKPDPFEDERVLFAISNPVFQSKNTGVKFQAYVNIPNISRDFNEVCDGLERRGIHVERSEKGARKGLFEFATGKLLNYLKGHSEKKDRPRFSQTAFDDCRELPVPLSHDELDRGLRAIFVIQAVVSVLALKRLIGHLKAPAHLSSLSRPIEHTASAKVTNRFALSVPLPRGSSDPEFPAWARNYVAVLFGFLLGNIFKPHSYDSGPHIVGLDWNCNQRSPVTSSEPVNAATQSIKNRDPFENESFDLQFPKPTLHVSRYRGESDLSISASVDIRLPRESSINEIHDGLERRGIHVDNSKEGVRRGLTEYALKRISEGVEKHQQKKCPCFDPSVSKEGTWHYCTISC